MVGASDGGGPKGTATTDREKISDGQTTGAAAVSPVRADEEENTERRPPVDPKLVALAAEVPDDSMPAALAADDASAGNSWAARSASGKAPRRGACVFV
ncbi:MAG TPA: hypothetical protein VM925_35990, partial [Labilithrix sp.]|nr:hypothetical protein [Labilithrix sp.]